VVVDNFMNDLLSTPFSFPILANYIYNDGEQGHNFFSPTSPAPLNLPTYQSNQAMASFSLCLLAAIHNNSSPTLDHMQHRVEKMWLLPLLTLSAHILDLFSLPCRAAEGALVVLCPPRGFAKRILLPLGPSSRNISR
jgi:hypothetical protein